MRMADHPLAEVQREYVFWNRILGDHAQFMVEGLAPTEPARVAQANQFRAGFRQLQEAGALQLTAALPAQTAQAATQLIDFTQHILGELLEGRVTIHLAPSLLVHMIEEAREFLEMHRKLREGVRAPLAMEMLDDHLLWLSDASGHAAALHARLDPTEAELRQQAAFWERLFDGLHKRAFEMTRALRGRPDYVPPALLALGRAAGWNIDIFRRWLEDLGGMLARHQVLGTAKPLLAEHMVREELYYLDKIRQWEAVGSLTLPPGRA